MQLFQPDNFSNSEIKYKEIETVLPVFKEILNQCFASSEIEAISQLDRNEINSENYKIVLQSDDQTSKTVLLRKHKVLSEYEKINFFLSLLQELSKYGVSASQVMETKNNELVVKSESDFYSIFGFIQANYFSPSLEAYISLAQVLAQLHLAFSQLGDDFIQKIENYSLEGKAYFNLIKDYTKDDFLEIKSIVENKQNKIESEKLLLESFPLILETIDKVKSMESKIAKLEKKIIHSDLHPHNVLMEGNKIKAIVDFDSVRINYQEKDVAMAIYRFGRQFFPSNEAKATTEASKLTDAFLTEYNKINPLTKEQKQLLPILLKDEFLIKLLFVLRGVYKQDNNAWINDLPKFIVSFKEIDYFWPDNLS